MVCSETAVSKSQRRFLQTEIMAWYDEKRKCYVCASK